MDSRLSHEIEHGKFLVKTGAGEVWNWESPAGKVRWKRRVEMLSSALKPGDEVLELGCGTGYFTKELVKLNIHITAIDISPDLIEEAKKTINSKTYKLSFFINNPPFFDEQLISETLSSCRIFKTLLAGITSFVCNVMRIH